MKSAGPLKKARNYLSTENVRNKRHAALYTRMIQVVYGKECDVLIGHHLVFEVHGKIGTENEVPSADTLLFDHEVMKAIFGTEAIGIMQVLATLPGEEREKFLAGKLI